MFFNISSISLSVHFPFASHHGCRRHPHHHLLFRHPHAFTFRDRPRCPFSTTNLPPQSENTSLMLVACRRPTRALELVQLLVEFGADPLNDPEGTPPERTFLSLSTVLCPHDPVVEWLLRQAWPKLSQMAVSCFGEFRRVRTRRSLCWSMECECTPVLGHVVDCCLSCSPMISSFSSVRSSPAPPPAQFI